MPFLAVAFLLSVATPVREVGPAVFHASSPRSAASVLDLAMAAPRLPASARHALPPLSAAEKASLSSRDSRSRVRRKVPAVRVGISRALPGGVGLAGGFFERAADGRLTWTAEFSSEGAGALRLHLRDVVLPAGTRVYVYAASGEVHGPYTFDGAMRPEGFWTNTVFAPSISLEVQWPAGASAAASRLTVSAVVHLDHSGFAPGAEARAAAALSPQAQECFVDAACVTPAEFSGIAQAIRAVGQLTFVDDGFAFVCSGGLLNSDPQSDEPYLLTANHCFDNQPAATSLEARWNYVRPTCDGPEPSPLGFPRTLGSTLLATGEESDFTFVRLSQNPPDGAVLLGWTTADVAHAGGTVLYRLSNPDGRPQFYTREVVSETPTPVDCAGLSQGDFIYEKDTVGGTGGGSSGALAYLENLSVVGQELGACGFNTGDDCDIIENSTLDGAFRVTFPSIAAWLAPAGDCTPDATTLCLNDGRFRVNVAWRKVSGETGVGQAVPLTADSGYFWFFSAANIELVAKVLGACSVNDHYWVFAGGLTNVETEMTVVDTLTGAFQTYTNPLGTAFQPIQDTSAFACP
jgi:hypothetical protein